MVSQILWINLKYLSGKAPVERRRKVIGRIFCLSHSSWHAMFITASLAGTLQIRADNKRTSLPHGKTLCAAMFQYILTKACRD